MKKTGYWIIGILIGLLLLSVFLAIPFFFMLRRGGFDWAMAPGMMDRNFGYHMPFGGLGMFAMWLIPLGIIGVLIAGAIASIVALTRPRHNTSLAMPTPPASPPVLACPSCGKPVKSGWVACPHCGASLKT